MTRYPTVHTLVIGAGPCGLGAAERLVELDEDRWLLVEGSGHVGGHARSVRDGAGFTWDIGGHVQYAHSPGYTALLQRVFPEGMNHHRRNSAAYLAGRFVPYPVQLNLAALPPTVGRAALADLAEAARTFPRVRHQPAMARFGRYLWAKYGATLYEAFLGPYNAKAWAIDPDEMGTYWVRDFLADVDVDQARRHLATGRLTTDWGYNTTFAYPRAGGSGEIWRRLGAQLHTTGRLALGVRVVGLDLSRRFAHMTGGGAIRYEHLVATAPLTTLCILTGDPALAALAGRLYASQLLVIGIGLEGERPAMLDGRSWLYVPAKDCPFHRLSVPSNYADANVPEPRRHWSLLAEMSAPPGQTLDQDRITRDALAWLAEHGFTKGARVVSLWRFHTPFGYPTPTLDRNEVLRAIRRRLEPHGVHTRGRNGSWVYETSNQDATYQQGRAIIDHLVTGTAQTPVAVS